MDKGRRDSDAKTGEKIEGVGVSLGDGTPSPDAIPAPPRGKIAYGRGGWRPGAGRPKFKPTAEYRERIAYMAGLYLTDADISTITGHSVATLRLRFHADLAMGRAQNRERIGRALNARGIDGGSDRILIHLAKVSGITEAPETQRHEIVGADGGPIEISRIERVVISAALESVGTNGNGTNTAHHDP